jgi:NADH:ubiquinone oxidoreductase subunit C
MSQEEKVKESLIAKFGYLEGKVNITRPRRIFITEDLKHLPEIISYAKDELRFNHLLTITGLDEGENLSFIYHLAHDSGVILNIKVSVLKSNPVINTITSYFVSAEIYERELEDLFGAQVEGLPVGNRYPLTDDWPEGEYPLRKDWHPKK